MKSSLEIAQEAELKPIEDDRRASSGSQPDEIEPYGRYKAKIALSASSTGCATRPTASSCASPA